ncbi:hypothetical protein OSB04_024123 [Centaurea solstitialis]|uniref:Uncharacterized protein n=1 Tax=Centaurea solstitialis TaxID=347529 RepID=A0AA38WDK4_9ASTR|nr:hypothetical protein OSB04_024123 [Centaurea solstitialis]
MEVGSPVMEVRGSSRSPREDNIKTNSEGAFNSKATKETCVGSLGTQADYVTKGEFQTFATEVSSLPTTDGISFVLNNISFDVSFLDSLKRQLASVGQQYAIDLENAAYHDFESFKKEIRALVNKAIVLDVTPDKGNPKSLATRGQLCEMVQCLGAEVRALSEKFLQDNRDTHEVQIRTINSLAEKTLQLQGCITTDISKALHNAIRVELKPVRKFSKLLSAKLKHAHRLNSRLQKARLTCSLEASKPTPKSQDDQDPDHPEGRIKKGSLSE